MIALLGLRTNLFLKASFDFDYSISRLTVIWNYDILFL